MSNTPTSWNRVWLLIASFAIVVTFVVFLVPNSNGAQGASIQAGCGIQRGAAVSRDQAVCIAKGLGMQRGLTEWRIGEGRDTIFDEGVWQIYSTIVQIPGDCGSWGMRLHVSKIDGQILTYSAVVTECTHDSVNHYPLKRPRE